MKKRIITLVASVLTVGLLLAVYFVINRLGNEGADETTLPPATSYTVAEIDRSTVYAVGYTYNDKSYDLMLKDDLTGWVLDSNKTLPISNTVMAYMIKHFELMTSDFKIENPTEQKLKDYGFDKPTTEIYFYDAKGRHGFTVGILNTFNSMYYIRSTDDPSNVYLVQRDFMEYFTLDEMGLIQIYEVMSASLTKEITLEITQGTDKLVYKYYPGGKKSVLSQSNSWFLSINGGSEFPINEKVAEALSESCGYFGFAQCLSYSSDDLEKYELINPAKVSLKYTNVTTTLDSETNQYVTTETAQAHTFLLGGKDNDGYTYAMADGEPLIYVTVSSVYSLLYGFDTDNISSICSAYASNAKADDVTSVKFDYESNSYELKSVETATGSDYYLNNKKLAAKKATEAIKVLSVIAWDNDRSNVPSAGEEKAILTVELSDGASVHAYVICTYSDEFYAVKTDFCDDLLVSAKAVDSILDAVKNIIQ